MKLKPQPRPTRRASRSSRRGATRVGGRGRGRQAQRPGTPLRARMARRLPSIRRLIAAAAAGAAVAGLVAMLNGPWLRVSDVALAGHRFTDAAAVESVLSGEAGRSVLAVDTHALRGRIEELPTVAEADVQASLTGRLQATVVERQPAMSWVTLTGQYLVDDAGVIFAWLPIGDELPDELAAAPRVLDQRSAGRLVRVGDTLPMPLLETTERIFAIDPAALGSRTPSFGVRVDDEFGFRLVSSDPAWEIALGVYGTDPTETSADRAARLERQVTAVRTLFEERDEVGIGWVDVRNPGKVYFRPRT